MGKIIAVASGKGGTGKTTFVANLGVALSKLGKKIIMVDADLDMANLELVLGMEGRPITLQDVLSGEAHVQDAIYDVFNGVKFVPAGISPAQFKRVDPEKLAKVLSDLGGYADIVLLDCPAGVGRDTIACFSACKETLLVMTPEPMSATDAYKTRAVAAKMGSEVIGIVVNLVRGTKSELKDKEISSLLSVPIIGRIPDDPMMREYVIQGKPILQMNPQSPASVAISKVAAGMVGETYIPEAPKKSLFNRMFGFLKKG
jgi:septum site-determining protein MinD